MTASAGKDLLRMGAKQVAHLSVGVSVQLQNR
jgi:hypothetical protein